MCFLNALLVNHFSDNGTGLSSEEQRGGNCHLAEVSTSTDVDSIDQRVDCQDDPSTYQDW